MRRVLLLSGVLLFAPLASAASQVHVTDLGDAYAVTFASNSTLPVRVSHDEGQTLARSVGHGLFRAELPPRTTRYEIEGRSFELPPRPASDATIRVVFVADMGVTNETRAISEAIARAKPDLVLIGGDLAYAHANETLWRQWFELVEPFAARTPTMPAFGNHEGYCEDAETAFDYCGPGPNLWHARFPLPNPE